MAIALLIEEGSLPHNAVLPASIPAFFKKSLLVLILGLTSYNFLDISFNRFLAAFKSSFQPLFRFVDFNFLIALSCASTSSNLPCSICCWRLIFAFFLYLIYTSLPLF